MQIITTTNSATGASDIIESAGARGIQILFVAGGLGDDDNRAGMSIAAISSDDNEKGGEVIRFVGIKPEATTAITVYPGITASDTDAAKSLSAVLPPLFQVSAFNTLGLPMTITVFADLIE